MAAPLQNVYAALRELWDPGGDEVHFGMLFDDVYGVIDVLMDMLCSSTATMRTRICRGFICSGSVLDKRGRFLTSVESILLDTGAQGCNFVGRRVLNDSHGILVERELEVSRIVRLGDKTLVSVTHEVDFLLSATDMKGVTHTHPITCSILENLSHGIVIGLIDLLGIFYPLFESAVTSVRSLLTGGSSDKGPGEVSEGLSNMDFDGINSLHLSEDSDGSSDSDGTSTSSNKRQHMTNSNRKSVRFTLPYKRRSQRLNNSRPIPTSTVEPMTSSNIYGDGIYMGYGGQHPKYGPQDYKPNTREHEPMGGLVKVFDLKTHTVDNEYYGNLYAEINPLDGTDSRKLSDGLPKNEPLYVDSRGNNIFFPWSKAMDVIAIEELETPDPVSFSDDILMYLTTTHEEAVETYLKDLETHIPAKARENCSTVHGMCRFEHILRQDKYIKCFVPTEWNGLNVAPLQLKVKPGMPDSLRPHPRPIRPDLYEPAKNEFNRMRTYFFDGSSSPIASPLVVAPKATTPFIRLCGD
jgi:hypothetical protein